MKVLVISHECTYGYHQPCSSVSLTGTWSEVSVCLSVMDLRASLIGRVQRKGEMVEERRENVSFHPSCPFTGGENLTWLTWTHLASLANRKCPLQLFFSRGGGCSCLRCNGQMLPIVFAFDFWPEKQKLTLQMSYDIFQIGLTFHSWPRGLLVCPL